MARSGLTGQAGAEVAGASDNAIAIVGIGCRFPGGIDSPESFWTLLAEGRDAITEVPPGRFDIDALFDRRPATPGRVMTRWGGFIDGLEDFDAGFFGMSPREAERLDPQQRLLLETAWHALEDAGTPPNAPGGGVTGVFVGLWLNDYEARLFARPDLIDFYSTIGSGRYAASGRLSYAFGFDGPAITVDTACSSSLVAVHLACQSLRSGECDAALAGAANVILEPAITIAYSQSRMMAPDGHCKFGDARGDGYVRSDGAGVLVLKRLADARRDGDRIYAVIRGSAVNNDGRTSGHLATPGIDGQELMLRRAYAHAGVEPSRVQYIEAHGTGTRAGDPVELQALGRVLGESRTGARCRVGSVKTNIGHTEGAAGLAGLIKVALAMTFRELPASLHFETPNPDVPWADLPLDVQRTRSPWPDPETTLLAGVSGFGIAGTNAHVVVEEAPAAAAPVASEAPPFALVLSAHTPEARAALGKGWADRLRGADDATLADCCYTAARRRTHNEHRAVIVGRTASDLVEGLDALVRGEAHAGVTTGRARPGTAHRVAFVFPGQGAQWAGMGRVLLEREPAFAQAMGECDAAVRRLTGWSVLDVLKAGDDRMVTIDVIQPVLFSMQVALAALWRAWGVEPAAVIGHSMGEVAAACVAGVLSLDDAALVICRRSALLRRTSGRGAMAVVELSIDEAQAALAGREDVLSVAVSNSARSTVVAGDPAALDELLAELEAREVFCRRVKVDVASHSPQMDPLKPDLLEAVGSVAPRESALTFCSTVRGKPIDGRELVASYWVDNLRQPVLFAHTTRRLLEDDIDTFVEVSPHPLLASAIHETASESGADVVVVSSGRRDEDESVVLRVAAGALHANGRPIDWSALAPAGRVVSTPLFPFQRERFWFEAAVTPAQGPVELPGEPILSSHEPDVRYYDLPISLDRFPFLGDHRVRGVAVVPAAWFLALVHDAAVRVVDAASLALQGITIDRALVLPEQGARRVQVTLSLGPGRSGRFAVASREEQVGGAARPEWTTHVAGSFSAVDRSAGIVTSGPSASGETFGAEAHYQSMARRGLQYGPAFRRVAGGERGAVALTCRLVAADAVTTSAAGFERRVTLLDGLLQAAVAVLPAGDPGDTFVPSSIEYLELTRDFDREPTLTAAATSLGLVSDGGAADADLRLIGADGVALIDARRVHLTRIEREVDRRVRDLLYRLEWRPAPLDTSRVIRAAGWALVGEPSPVSRALAQRLEAAGAQVTMASDVRALELSAVESGSVAGVVLLAPSREADGFDAAVDDAFAVVDMVRTLAGDEGTAPRCWLVTFGTQPVGERPVIGWRGSASWGLRSVAASEYPRLRCSAVDLPAEPGELDLDLLAAELLTDGADDEIALSGGQRFVRRLERGLPDGAADRAPARPAAGRPYRAVTTSPGIIEAIGLEEASRPAPGADQIEIEVRATGLNFMNVLSAMGMYPGYPRGVGPLGIECAGVVTRAGSNVQGLEPGDPVVAFAHDSLATHALAHRALVARMPSGLTFTNAASIPIAFLTAHYALAHLARLVAGERVLIHAATGGVGLAALQVARALGAEVYATAGSEEKRTLLRSLGVAHVADSRSLTFADEIRRATHGEGVDVVLNSLAGEAIAAGLGLLRQGGRFLEIGKRDIYENRMIGLLPFQRNLSYFAIDLDRLGRDNPELVGRYLREVVEKVTDGTYRALPVESVPVTRVTDAFRKMAQGAHTGKLVIEIDHAETPVRPRRSAWPARWDAGTVLVTGGTGGLGLAVCRWLVQQGARSLVLVSRSGEGTAAAQIEDLRSQGADVRVAAGDVSRMTDVEQIIADITASPRPLLGVIHAAGLLDDATIARLERAQFERVAAPKIAGARNLHAATANLPIDFFVLFSSVASFLGLAGQAAYAASNAALDHLASFRRERGLPAISIGWGPWADVGLAAAREDRGARLARSGLGSVTPAQGVAAFARILEANPTHAVAMEFDAAAWLASRPGGLALLSDLAGERGATTGRVADAAPEGSIREVLAEAPAGRQRRAVIETFVQQQVAEVLKLAPTRIDPRAPLRTMGLDSLMGLELRNRLEAGTGAALPATLIWNYPTVEALAPQVAARMGIALEESVTAPAPVPGGASSRTAASPGDEDVEALLQEIEQLSDDEARRLLAEDRVDQ